jgi:L-lactate utilization protein LutB
VCPVKIPLPDLQRKLREQAFERRLRPWSERAALKAWAWVARRPGLYAAASRLGVRALRMLARGDGTIRRLPFGRAWSAGRDMPAPTGRTFRELYAARRNGESP